MINTVSLMKNNQKCEVNFFKRWTGYSHPVKVVEPIDFAAALIRGNYQRAWTCEKNSKSLFVLLERVEAHGVKDVNIKLNSNISFFHAEEVADGTHKVGRQITISETFYLDYFYVEATEVNGQVGKFLIQQKTGGNFEYIYDSTGKFIKLRVTNDEGVVTELDY